MIHRQSGRARRHSVTPGNQTHGLTKFRGNGEARCRWWRARRRFFALRNQTHGLAKFRGNGEARCRWWRARRRFFALRNQPHGLAKFRGNGKARLRWRRALSGFIGGSKSTSNSCVRASPPLRKPFLGTIPIGALPRTAVELFALVLAVVGALAVAATPARAHEVRPAYLQVAETDPGVFSVLWKQPVLQDRRLAIDPVFPDECAPASPVIREVTGSALLQSWTIECPLRQGAIHISGLSRTITDVMVEITRLNGEKSTHLLRPDSPSLDLSDPSPQVAAYLTLGVEHLVFGIDHVLFVIGLVLFIPNRWALLKTITAFTIAHSITLALSVLELVRLPQAPVEAVIALSILFLARELTMPEARRSALTRGRPWIMALLFGLLHGFGFAGALADIGLPREQLALSLFLFNVGIEIGQIAIIAALLALLWCAHRIVGNTALAERAFIYAMGSLAAFWTIDRVLPIL